MEEKSASYFEGILQLRDTSNEVLNYVKHLVGQKPDVHIAKIQKLKTGLDIYISSQRFLRTLGLALQKKFGGELVVSRRLHTTHHLTSRFLYRVNVLFRQHHCKKGDIITVRGKKYEVINCGKKIFCRDIKTNQKVQLNYNMLK